MAKETWRQAKRWKGYDVSDKGRIRSYWQQRATASVIDRDAKPVVMTPSSDVGGRQFVIIHDDDGRKKNASLPRLILDTFERPGTKRDKVVYKDENPRNLKMTNLSWRRLPALRIAAGTERSKKKESAGGGQRRKPLARAA